MCLSLRVRSPYEIILAFAPYVPPLGQTEFSADNENVFSIGDTPI